MKISREEVLHIAELSALKLTEEEVERFGRELSAVVEYIEKLNGADLGQVDAAEHAMAVPPRFREDVPQPSLSPADVLKNAPRSGEGFFQVPRVI